MTPGSTGNEGIIGWYVPKAFADANPDILTAATDPTVLNKYADQFKTSESGDKGQLLDGDPSFVTNDEAMVENLGLELQGRLLRQRGGLEQGDQGRVRRRQADPRLLLRAQLVQRHGPAGPHPAAAVHATAATRDPKKVACDYPPYHLNKIVSTKFADERQPVSST